MNRRRSRSMLEAVPLEPSGLSTSPSEVARDAAERAADLRAERWLLAREVVIIVAIALVVGLLQGPGA